MDLGSFNEAAQEAWDFARCQRPDGTYYGTGGTCRKGSQVADLEKRIARQERFLRTANPSKYSPKEIEVEKKELQRLKSQLAGMKSTKRKSEAEAKSKDEGEKSQAPIAPVPPKSKMTKRDPVAAVLKSQEDLKDFHKKENARLMDMIKAGKVKGVSMNDVKRIQKRRAEGG